MPGANSGNEYVKLENRLVLLAWLNDRFGYKANRELLADMKLADEGFDPRGRSYIYHRLVGRGEKLKIPPADLVRYDENIRGHLAAINERRPQPITLRYFQHLALLYSEFLLDWGFNHPGDLLRLLNDYVQDRNARKPGGEPADSVFTNTDLTKLAFWMATGSGKTLIMHVNYRQFLHYNHKVLDNILLITPNVGLTEQHMRDMLLSGIPCVGFSLSESGLGLPDRNTVRVIEITKLVEEKRGGGVSVPVDAFEGNNLIFVDEGHKGSGGEAWRSYRDALGQTGFTFEYSATFGQALTAARNDALTEEYGKAIAFDYSYRYFHGDGYGKDFRVLNLREVGADDQTETLLLGNLLSFYEQQRCFDEQANQLRPYNLERPLWVFVGSSVNAVYAEDRQKRSDVLTVARFLHHFLENKRSWAVRTIQRIIDGKTGLVDGDGEDVFAGKFEYLRSSGQSARDIYRHVLAGVFHAPSGGALHLCALRSQAGELGLRASNAEHYFGLIYIGDTSSFKGLVDADDSGIQVEEDVVGESLFRGIGESDTSVNILIGAKKFMEGWNSWRVSNMGLLNIGRTEGSEIIQLFGRGVRLHGLGFGLKRSSALDGRHPDHIRLLETLNVFSVRAKYMAQFREDLEREGVETRGAIELPLAIRANKGFLGKGLLVPRVSNTQVFATEYDVALAADPAARVIVDVSLRAESIWSVSGRLETVSMEAGHEQVIPPESLELVDWSTVYVRLLEFKDQKGFSNLVITPDVPRKLLEQSDTRLYRLIADPAVVKPRSFAQVSVLQETVLSILRKYAEKYYRVCQERWESANMAYGQLAADDPNFSDYTVRIPGSETLLIAAVRELIDEGKRIYETDTRELPNIHFDRHLYQPLLVERGDLVRSVPPGLRPSEEQFLKDIRDYVRKEAGASLAAKEVFLLRNLSRGKGIGFFENEGFFPDFILWVKEATHQRIVFVEPHGMLHERSYWNSDKATLHERLDRLSERLAKESGFGGIVLDAFLISATPYDSLRAYYGDGSWTPEDFARCHILFFNTTDVPSYCARLLQGG